MESKRLKINQNKSGSGSISNRIILPASWVKELELVGEVIATKVDGKIIIENIKKEVDNVR